MIDPAPLRDYFTGLQTRLVAATEAVEGTDGGRFRVEPVGQGSRPGSGRPRLHLRHRGWQYQVIDADHAQVEFVARSRVGGGPATRLHEISHFVCEDGRWFYVDGSFPKLAL